MTFADVSPINPLLIAYSTSQRYAVPQTTTTENQNIISSMLINNVFTLPLLFLGQARVVAWSHLAPTNSLY